MFIMRRFWIRCLGTIPFWFWTSWKMLAMIKLRHQKWSLNGGCMSIISWTSLYEWNSSWNFKKKIREHRKQRTFYQVFWIQEKKFNLFILRNSTFERSFIHSPEPRSLGSGLLGAHCVTSKTAVQLLWTQLLHLTRGGVIPLIGIEVFPKHRSKVSRSQKLNCY